MKPLTVPFRGGPRQGTACLWHRTQVGCRGQNNPVPTLSRPDGEFSHSPSSVTLGGYDKGCNPRLPSNLPDLFLLYALKEGNYRISRQWTKNFGFRRRFSSIRASPQQQVSKQNSPSSADRKLPLPNVILVHSASFSTLSGYRRAAHIRASDSGTCHGTFARSPSVRNTSSGNLTKGNFVVRSGKLSFWYVEALIRPSLKKFSLSSKEIFGIFQIQYAVKYLGYIEIEAILCHKLLWVIL